MDAQYEKSMRELRRARNALRAISQYNYGTGNVLPREAVQHVSAIKQIADEVLYTPDEIALLEEIAIDPRQDNV
jgi:hypothetical protein